jgi:hypothetical protein
VCTRSKFKLAAAKPKATSDTKFFMRFVGIQDGGQLTWSSWNLGHIYMTTVDDSNGYIPMFSRTPDTVEQRLTQRSACTRPNCSIWNTLVCNCVVAVLILMVVLRTYGVVNSTWESAVMVLWKTLVQPLEWLFYIFGHSYNYFRFGGRHLEFRPCACRTWFQTSFRCVGRHWKHGLAVGITFLCYTWPEFQLLRFGGRHIEFWHKLLHGLLPELTLSHS